MKLRTLFIPLVTDKLATTNATQGDSITELDVDLGDTFLHAEDVTLVTNTQQRTAFHNWTIGFYPGWSRTYENAVVNILGAAYINANGVMRHGAYNSQANFLPHTRPVLITKNASGTALESAIVSAGLLVKYWGV